MRPEDLARLEDWHIWPGVNGAWYARYGRDRGRMSPPWVISDRQLGRLQRRIVEGEQPPWRTEPR
jgi:hypothetical protein